MAITSNTPHLKAEQVRELLTYDPKTGRLFWKRRAIHHFCSEAQWKRWNTRYADREALTTEANQGYRQGAIFGRQYLAHRVAWLIETGEWPVREIDHKNGVRSDNRWTNLHEAGPSANMRNLSLSRTNTSGVTGVVWDKREGKWRAQISILKKCIHLGYFDTIEGAALARQQANAENGFSSRHGEPANCDKHAAQRSGL